VKATAPIWKREHHPGGAEWVQCHHAHHSDTDPAPDRERATA